VGKLYRYILLLAFHLFHLKYSLPLQKFNRLPHFKKLTNKGKQVQPPALGSSSFCHQSLKGEEAPAAAAAIVSRSQTQVPFLAKCTPMLL